MTAEFSTTSVLVYFYPAFSAERIGFVRWVMNLFCLRWENLDDDLAAMKREGYEGWEMVLYSYGPAMFVSAAVRLEHFLNA